MTEKIQLTQTYPVIIHQEGQQYWAEVPDIPSAFTTGETVEEVLTNIREAIELALATTLVVPKATAFTEVDSKDGLVQLVQVSLGDYLKRVSKKVRKNVTVPAYLGELAKKNGDNVSDILTKALEKRYGLG